VDLSTVWQQLLGSAGALVLALVVAFVIWRQYQQKETECQKCREAYAQEFRQEHEARLQELKANAADYREAALAIAKAVDRLNQANQTSGPSRPT
jgi:uncharacterized protein YeaO (DUF488 family)